MSFIERCFLVCPYSECSFIGGSTVVYLLRVTSPTQPPSPLFSEMMNSYSPLAGDEVERWLTASRGLDGLREREGASFLAACLSILGGKREGGEVQSTL